MRGAVVVGLRARVEALTKVHGPVDVLAHTPMVHRPKTAIAGSGSRTGDAPRAALALATGKGCAFGRNRVGALASLHDEYLCRQVGSEHRVRSRIYEPVALRVGDTPGRDQCCDALHRGGEQHLEQIS